MTRILVASVLTLSLVAGQRAAEASCTIRYQQVFPQQPVQQWNNTTRSYESVPIVVGRNCGVHVYLAGPDSATPPSFAGVVIRSPLGTHRFTVSEEAPIHDVWTVTGYFEGQKGCTEQKMDVQFAHHVLTPTELLPAGTTFTVEGLEALGGGLFPASLPFQTDDSTSATCGLAGLVGPSCGFCPPPASGSPVSGSPASGPPASGPAASGEADDGGCSVGGAGGLPSALIVLLPLALAARRRRSRPR